MKKKTIAAAVLLLAVSTVSYWIGWNSHVETKLVIEKCDLDHTKDYQAACILSDICRMALDDPYLDNGGFEDLYWDYILNLDTDPSVDITWEQVHRDYYHMY